MKHCPLNDGGKYCSTTCAWWDDLADHCEIHTIANLLESISQTLDDGEDPEEEQ